MKLIAITGSGRSGSTLLSLLLSQDGQVFNLGQMRHLARAYQANAPCSCGQTLQDCEVYSRLFADPRAPEPDVLDQRLRAFFKAAKRAGDWSSDRTLSALGTSQAEALSDLSTCLDILSDLTGCTTFVDSSKMPEMALALELAKPGSLYALNLIRDPRAVAVSWHKKSPRLLSTVRSIREYSARQARLQSWAPALGDRFHRMKYEDFAADPVDALSKATSWAGLAPPEMFHSSHEAMLSWDRQHLFPPANESVLAKRPEALTVSESVSWKGREYAHLHLLTRVLAPRDMKPYD